MPHRPESLRSVAPMAEHAPVGASIALAAEPISAERARRWLREVLIGSGREDCLDVAELACTELVTNAVLHAHTGIDVTVLVGADVRVAVRDFSSQLPEVRSSHDVQATTGRGLSLVAAIVDEHGIEADPDGKTMWFSVGGHRPERSAEELLAAWDDADWEVDEPEVTAREETRTVRLLGLPPAMWLATRQHHDALLRELVLYSAAHPVPGADAVTADLARGMISSAALAAIEAAGSAAGPPPGPGGERALACAPPPLDVELSVPTSARPMFGVLQDTLDAAERLAATGRLLAHRGLPEVIALRDWVCDQVVAQLAGVEPTPWPGLGTAMLAAPPGPGLPADGGGDAARQLIRPAIRDSGHDPVAEQVRTSDRPVIAADGANRIVAVSRPMAQLVGWDPDQLVGRRIVVLVPPRLREAHVAGFTRHLTTGEAHFLGVPTVVPVLRADGREVDCTMLLQQPPGNGRSVYLAWFEVSPAR